MFMSIDRKEIGVSLKLARKLRGLTQAQMAINTGIDRSIISKMESGEFSGSFAKLQKYALYLRMKFTVVAMCDSLPSYDELEKLFPTD